MAGTRNLSDDEYKLVINSFENKRDKCLFILARRTGFRISELLSLTIKDVYQNNKIVDRICITRRYMKGKKKSREVVLHLEARNALASYLFDADTTNPNAALFRSYKTGQAITRQRAHVLFKTAYNKCSLEGKLACHSPRKSYAEHVYKKLSYDIVATSKAMGHSSVLTTIAYLNPSQDEIDKAILED